MSYEDVSKTLNAAVLQLTPAELPQFLADHDTDFTSRPFTDYMRMKFRKKGITQKDVFIAADLDDKTGYKLISSEKHTLQRDTILRICLAARFSPDETQEALILYGFAPLHARNRRDTAFMVAFSNRINDIHDVDAILRENNLPPFLTSDQVDDNISS